MSAFQTILAELGGCTTGVACTDRKMVLVVLMALNRCEEHGGVHHFAVINEGTTVIMSPTGMECLVAQGVVLTETPSPNGDSADHE